MSSGDSLSMAPIDGKIKELATLKSSQHKENGPKLSEDLSDY